MKSIFALVLLFALSLSGLKAQTPISVKEDSLTVGKSTMPSLTVNIPEVKYESALKSWTKELQSGTKSKLVTENNSMTIFGAKIKDVSPNPINVYSKMSYIDSTVLLSVTFEIKKDQYIERSSSETDLNKAKNYLKEFAKNEYLDVAKDQADAQDKKLHDMQKELSSLERDKSKLQKTIESDNTDITSEKQNIEVQKNELAAVSNELVEQNKQLSSPDSPDAIKKEKTDYINTLEKRQKKAQSSLESSQNKINKANNEVDKLNQEIPNNEKQQQELNEKIQVQQAITQKYDDRVKAIKSY
jgi:peptidoglycan hydrolase CwlO-like protein